MPAEIIKRVRSKEKELDVEKKSNWMSFARGELGVSEIAGDEDNPRIIYYHSFTSLKATSDEVAWCASFVCAALEVSGIKSTRSARAKDYIHWENGSRISNREAIKYGDILVFARDGGATGHVGFFVRWSTPNDCYSDPIVLGGNQGNKVSEKRIGMELIAARRPRGRKPLTQSRTVKTAVITAATAAATAAEPIYNSANDATTIINSSKPLIDIFTQHGGVIGSAVAGVLTIIGIGYMVYCYIDRRNNKKIEGGV